MNYFTQELQRILCNCTAAEQVSYAGRSAYVRMDQDLRARIEFASMHISGHYDAIRASILNRVDGKVDIAVFHFSDLLGYKKTSNPNFSKGIIPYICDDCGKPDWYVYRPTSADYKLIAENLDEYFQVFQTQQADMHQQMY